MLSESVSANSRTSSPAKNSMPTGQPQRKLVWRWCLASNVERPGVIHWQIKVVAMLLEAGWQKSIRHSAACKKSLVNFSWKFDSGSFYVKLLTNKHKERQTDKCQVKHNVLSEGNQTQHYQLFNYNHFFDYSFANMTHTGQKVSLLSKSWWKLVHNASTRGFFPCMTVV